MSNEQTNKNLGGKNVNNSNIPPVENAETASKERESIILKGIATTVNSMKFPNFEELNKMLNRFDYELKENYPKKCGEPDKKQIIWNDAMWNNYHDRATLYPNKTDEEVKLIIENSSFAIEKSIEYDENDFTQIPLKYGEFLKDMANKSESTTTSIKFLKKILLCQNIVSEYNSINYNFNKDILEIYKLKNEYINLINLIIENNYIWINYLPIFKLNNIIYEVSKKQFNNLNIFKKFIINNEEFISILNFIINNDNSVDLRYCKFNKEKNNDSTLTWDFKMPDYKNNGDKY
jgi:hypothetical protein